MNSLTSTVLILISVGLFYTFTSHQYSEAQRLQDIKNDYQEVLDSASAIIEARDRLLIEYESIPPVDIDRLNKLLPDDVDTVRLALDLDSVAANYGIAISELSAAMDTEGGGFEVSDDIGGSPYDKVNVTFKFLSDYESFTSFVSDIERSLRIMDVKTVSFQIEETDVYEHEISVTTYWLK